MENELKCPLCGKIYQKENFFEAHMEKEKKALIKLKTNNPKINCEEVMEKTGYTKDALMAYIIDDKDLYELYDMKTKIELMLLEENTAVEIASKEETAEVINIKPKNDTFVVEDWLKRAGARFRMNGSIIPEDYPKVKEIYLKHIINKLPGCPTCPATYRVIMQALIYKFDLKK